MITALLNPVRDVDDGAFDLEGAAGAVLVLDGIEFSKPLAMRPEFLEDFTGALG